MTDHSTGQLLSELVKDQLADERNIKNSLAQRATVLVAGAGTVITLSLGAIGLITRGSASPIPTAAVVTVICALIALVAAAVVALLINAPWSQQAINMPSYSESRLNADWRQQDDTIAISIYQEYVQLLEDLRRSNERRSWWLTVTFLLELLALLGLSASVGIVLSVGMYPHV